MQLSLIHEHISNGSIPPGCFWYDNWHEDIANLGHPWQLEKHHTLSHFRYIYHGPTKTILDAKKKESFCNRHNKCCAWYHRYKSRQAWSSWNRLLIVDRFWGTFMPFFLRKDKRLKPLRQVATRYTLRRAIAFFYNALFYWPSSFWSPSNANITPAYIIVFLIL